MNSPEHVTRRAYTIADFCAAFRMGRNSYYAMKRAGLGPREIRHGSLIRISVEAAAEWERARSNPVGDEAKRVALDSARLLERNLRAVAKAVASPKHVSRRESAAQTQAAMTKALRR